LHNIFAFNNNGPRIDHIAEKKNKSQKKKNKIKRKEPINKSMKIPKYFRNFLILKWGLFNHILKWKRNKIYGQSIRVCFAKHTLSQHNLGRLGQKPGPGPLFFLHWAGSSPAVRAGLDPATQPGYWSKPVTRLAFICKRAWLAHAR
jgi:hypothetical protein